jgi:hypothetical protein
MGTSTHKNAPGDKKPAGNGPTAPIGPMSSGDLYALNCCVHYLCLRGWVYVFYVGHIDKIVKPFSML